MTLAVHRLQAAGVIIPKPTADLVQYNHTSNTSLSGTVAASTNAGAGFEEWRAFDGDITTATGIWFASTSSGWLRYLFTTPRAVSSYTLQCSQATYAANRAPNTWTAEVSWDASSWVVVDSRSGSTGWASLEIRTFAIRAPITAPYFRINISASDGGAVTGVQEMRMYGR